MEIYLGHNLDLSVSPDVSSHQYIKIFWASFYVISKYQSMCLSRKTSTLTMPMVGHKHTANAWVTIAITQGLGNLGSFIDEYVCEMSFDSKLRQHQWRHQRSDNDVMTVDVLACRIAKAAGVGWHQAKRLDIIWHCAGTPVWVIDPQHWHVSDMNVLGKMSHYILIGSSADTSHIQEYRILKPAMSLNKKA